MKDEQLERANQIKKQLEEVQEHKKDCENRLQNGGQRLHFSGNSNSSITLRDGFLPVAANDYMNFYIQKLDAAITKLQEEYNNL